MNLAHRLGLILFLESYDIDKSEIQQRLFLWILIVTDVPLLLTLNVIATEDSSKSVYSRDLNVIQYNLMIKNLKLGYPAISPDVPGRNFNL